MSSTSTYRLTISRAPDAATKQCELDVLAHWYGDTEQLLEEVYGPYATQTAFLAVERDDGVVVGTSRLIMPGRLQLKTIVDVAGPPWSVEPTRTVSAAGIDLDHTWDVTTIAVRRELGASGRMVAAALYYGIVHAARANQCPWIVAIIDRRARSLLSLFGLPLTALPGTVPQRYMGSEACAPVFAHLPSLVNAQHALNPEGYRLITRGHGLTDVALPHDDDLALHDAAPLALDAQSDGRPDRAPARPGRSVDVSREPAGDTGATRDVDLASVDLPASGVTR